MRDVDDGDDDCEDAYDDDDESEVCTDQKHLV